MTALETIVEDHKKTDNVTINPATEEEIDHHHLHTRNEAQTLVTKAHEAFMKWRDVPINQRAEKVKKIAEALENNKDIFAAMMTKEMGKPIKQSFKEVDVCIAICNYTAEHCPARLEDEEREIENGRGLITYQPIGVILAIEPWNFPLYQVIRYAIPNLLAGNTSLLKHAKNVWGTAKLIDKTFKQAGLPDGCFDLLFIENETVEDIIANDYIKGVTLTGSAAAGSAVAKLAGNHIKKSVLELGGSDPYIILEDAPINDVVKTCVQGRLVNNGQTCTAAKRFIILDEVYDKFRGRFIAMMSAASYGDPTDEATRLGPMARADLREDLHKQVLQSIKKGATCALGGELPEGKGFYYPPTVLENVAPGMPAYDDELFGPVASLIRAKDEEDAIRIANDHKYGLGGGIFTGDQARGIDIARTKIETGMMNVNGYNLAQPNMPFGGIKQSGYGREHGGFGVREFVNIKSVIITE